MPKCEVDHCVREARFNVEVIGGDVWLCDWHDYWKKIPPQRSAVEARVEEKV